MKVELDLEALFSLSYGLYIVASRMMLEDGTARFNGQISNTLFQVTAEPPRVAVSINKQALTHEYIQRSGVFAAAVLEDTVPLEFVGRFGFKSGREVDKFAGVSYELGVTGCPVVTEYTVAAVEGKVVRTLDVETHTLFVAEVVSARFLRRGGQPLTYAVYRKIKHGRASRYAPTYRLADAAPGMKQEGGRGAMQRYVCSVCGYVYDPEVGDAEAGVAAGTAFEDLPEDWVCPVCGAAKELFSPEE